MSYSKEKPSTYLPYGEMITRILRNVNINTQKKKSISSNNKIDYPGLRDMKINIKYEKLRDDWTNEEEDTKETKDIDIKQVWEIGQGISRDMKEMKKIISR